MCAKSSRLFLVKKNKKNFSLTLLLYTACVGLSHNPIKCIEVLVAGKEMSPSLRGIRTFAQYYIGKF